MNLITSLAVGYAIACLGVIGFQIALIAGAPWGRITQGGKHQGALPISGRVAAFVSIFILAAMACAILSAVGIWPNWPRWTGRVALGVQALVTLVNWITPSKPERMLWGPVESVLLAMATVVVLVT
ncbi:MULTISPECIES: hypothetical protein [unclassified Dinoroseobacter]|uniref:hypothetical protein n=1 Tax=unclassified Dinoroseobacter TaxID=2620028 RepID=UPI003C7B6EF5